MKLHWSPTSPFVRKVMIVLHEKGIQDQVVCVRTPVGMAKQPDPTLLIDNPLAKIPTLVLDDGRALFDSRVIAEHLDAITDRPKLFPAEPCERQRQLRWMALADGLTDILNLWYNELGRPTGMQYPELLSVFEAKTRACFLQLEVESDEIQKAAFGIGHVALICSLGYLDLRFGNTEWRQAHPALAGWYENAESRPSVCATDAVGVSAPAGANFSVFSFLRRD
jgi:glutathione S-transferase